MSKLGFRNWLPEIANCKIKGRPVFQGRPQYTLYMYLLIEIRHDILHQCHGSCIYRGKTNSIICLKMTFQEITLKNIWVS